MRQGTANRAMVVWCVLLLGVSAAHARDAAQITERHLSNGDLIGGEIALKQRLGERPGDDQARYGLGVIQFLHGVERVCQKLHGYGFGSGMAKTDYLPGLRLPMPVNDNPKTLDYKGLTELIEGFLDDLATAEATLAGIKDQQIKLPLHIGLVRLDLDGDGVASDDESLWSLYYQHTLRSTVTRDAAKEFYIGFDTGDMHWLRGYCHLLSALCELVLAHDWQVLFETTGHLLFPKVQSQFEFLNGDRKLARMGEVEVMDVVTALHLMRGPMIDRDRMTSALEHLQAMTDQSMLSWHSIINEKDNDNEWIPSATQQSVVPTIRVSVEMIGAWQELMQETRAILGGTKLMPFWRGSLDDGVGVNIRKAFTESQGFDLILWIQGSGMKPFLEKNKPISKTSFEELQRAFSGRFFPYAVLFN